MTTILVTKARMKDTEPQEVYDRAELLSALDQGTYGPGARKANHFLAPERYAQYIASIAEICRDHPEEFSIPKEKTSVQGITLAKISKNVYSLENPELTQSEYRLLNANGLPVFSGTIIKGNNRLDFTKLPVGIYFYNQKGKSPAQRIFIEP